MKFDDFDLKMRKFETASDICVADGVHMVARIDGRSFTRLTKTTCGFEVPFDQRFRNMMVSATRSLMQCGFHVVYGYVQSDEISLLFDVHEKQFGRKTRKFNSVLAGHASAHFSLAIGQLATFDCRISQLPDPQHVVDYFRWRQQDAIRNALNSWCYWTMRESGLSRRAATRRMIGMTVTDKKQTLLDLGINFESQPLWQRHGVGLSWQRYVKKSVDRLTGESVDVSRRQISVDFDLPRGESYSSYLRSLIE